MIALCFSYSFNKRPNQNQVIIQRSHLVESINDDLNKILQWGLENRVEFNASKTQSCFLTHRSLDPLPILKMGSVDIVQTNTLNILGLTIESDMRWNAHIFSVAKNAAKNLGFLKRCKKYFSPSDLRNIYVSYIRPKMEYNSHIWAGASGVSLQLLDRVQNRAKKLIGDPQIAETLDSLELRRNVGCLTLFYRYFYGGCSEEITDTLPSIKVFGRPSRFSSRAHHFHIDERVERTTHYRANSFFSRTVRMWNSLPANTFPAEYNIGLYKSNVYKFLKGI